MTKPPLGRLNRVQLREYWQREDTHFTPWLAGEENIALLGDTLGLDLEVQQQEAQVGPFRADILCRNTADNSLVLIENQLERTDHSHLGQLFTYAAGLETVTIIWIASRFTEEHRAAVDWLNRITHDDFHFFGLEIELWRIGDSAPAPKFNIVAKPNDWAKVVAEARNTGGRTLTSGQEKQIAFWADFGRAIEDSGRKWKVPKPQPASWVGYGIGRSGIGLFPTVSVKADWGAIRLSMEESFFHLLAEDRESIEAELGFALEWKEKPGRKECTIEVQKSGKLTAAKSRAALIDWMLKTMDAFDSVFRPRIKQLDLSDWSPPEAVE